VLSPCHKEFALKPAATETLEEVTLKRTIELTWIRIQERFSTFSAAFRFFDKNQCGKVTFDMFLMSCDALKVKLSSKDLHLVFKFLDRG